MIRYLIVLECFLVALLISPWFGSAVPDNGPHKEPLADQPVTHAGVGIQVSEETSSGGMGRDALSAADRVILTRELLGSSEDGSSAAEGGGLSGHDARRPSSIDPATVLSDSAASAATGLPARTDESLTGQATRGAEAAPPGLSPPSVAAAQRHLSRLGYSPGAADGVLGERTRRALADYRRRTGAADGLLSETLIARLRRDADRAARDSQRRRVVSYLPRDEHAPRWVASIAGGFQRLLGHEFDSKKQPGRIREYCLRNQETWIFDEGRAAFTYCGHLAASR